MGRQIIKQPDGKFAIFSSMTDTIIVYDASAAEVIVWFAEEAAQRTRDEVERLIGHVDSGRPQEAYGQFVMTWDEALAEDREHEGEAWKDWTL